MGEIAHSRGGFALDTIKQLDKGASGKSGLLGLAHL